jgi:DNA-binding PadR family transcriptional regulator
MPPKSFLGEFEQIVLLAILQKDDKAYGVEVRREIEECSGRKVTRGAFYTTLDRLESKGYLRWTTRPVEGWRGGIPQRHFIVTDKGREKLKQSRTSLTKLWRGFDEKMHRT